MLQLSKNREKDGCPRFHWPKEERELLKIGKRQLSWLLEGLVVSQAHTRLEYCEIDELIIR